MTFVPVMIILVGGQKKKMKTVNQPRNLKFGKSAPAKGNVREVGATTATIR